jgi:hypothetical protein
MKQVQQWNPAGCYGNGLKSEAGLPRMMHVLHWMSRNVILLLKAI